MAATGTIKTRADWEAIIITAEAILPICIRTVCVPTALLRHPQREAAGRRQPDMAEEAAQARPDRMAEIPADRTERGRR